MGERSATFQSLRGVINLADGAGIEPAQRINAVRVSNPLLYHSANRPADPPENWGGSCPPHPLSFDVHNLAQRMDHFDQILLRCDDR
jgi:hypothetical protein